MSWSEFLEDFEHLHGPAARRLLEASYALDGQGISPSDEVVRQVLGWSDEQVAAARESLLHGLLANIDEPLAEPDRLTRLLAQLLTRQ